MIILGIKIIATIIGYVGLVILVAKMLAGDHD